MKNKIGIFLFLFILFFSFLDNSKASSKIVITFFHGDGCPHCEKEEEFLDNIKNKYDNIEIISYEVWYSKDNENLMKEYKTRYGETRNGVPFTIIGNESFLGFNNAIGAQMEDAIINYQYEEDSQNNSNFINNLVFKILFYFVKIAFNF